MGIRSSPAYPGDRIGESVDAGEIHEFTAKRIVHHNDGKGRAVEIFFYELADGRGWIHDYHPNSPPGHRAITVLRGARALKVALEKHEANAEPNLAARARERLRELATQDLAEAIEGFDSSDGGRASDALEAVAVEPRKHRRVRTGPPTHVPWTGGVLHQTPDLSIRWMTGPEGMRSSRGDELTNWRAWEPAGSYEKRLAARLSGGRGKSGCPPRALLRWGAGGSG